MFKYLLSALTFIGFASAAQAQPLIERVPGNATLYAGWYGLKDIADRYEGSHLQGVMQASQLQQLCDEVVPALVELMVKSSPHEEQIIRTLASLLTTASQHTSAIYVGGMDPRRLSPHMVLLIEAGDRTQPLLEEIQILLMDLGNVTFPLLADADGDLLRVVIGFVPNETSKLADNEAFKAALAHVDADPVAILYTDPRPTFALLDAQMDSDPVLQQMVTSAGFDKLQQIIFTVDFHEHNWATRGFISAPAPRKGYVGWLEQDPVDNSTLKLIPESPSMAFAWSGDVIRYITVMKETTAIDERMTEQYDRSFKRINAYLGIDLRADLLEPLGNQWALYTDPHIGGDGLFGMVLINRADDGQQAYDALTKAITSVTKDLSEKSRDFKFHVAAGQYGDLKFHYVTLPGIAPCWTLHDGNIYMAAYPQVLDAAIRHSASGGKSLADNATFNAMIADAGAKDYSSALFMNLPELVPHNYRYSLVVGRLLALADSYGIPSPVMLLPPMDKLLPHLEPAASFTWTDDAGWYMHHVQPFPGATWLATEEIAATYVGPYVAMAPAMLPSMLAAQEQARAVASMSNLRQIGMAVHIYGNDHRGQHPHSFGTLAGDGYIRASIFASPRQQPKSPPEENGERGMEWVDANSDYVYIFHEDIRKIRYASETVHAYEKVISGSEGTAVLFVDGHVEWVSVEDLEALAEKGGFEIIYAD